MGDWQTKYEAFETNDWYNDISTRDRSREGAEEAIDLSEGSKTRIIQNYLLRSPCGAAAPQHLGVRTDSVSVLLPER